ncbi:BZ3500_MvSof-1268-A1-R1_Chr4-1g06694 [Microbotryum saponariae]|uniref:BZ3500_MvSof-1268-A1-R1_Chr4-1g06694 protein n=1 Tax=Microbotryum saponariae TaxID=289078 RepID=A0A2X0LCZ6_9BASI|nr:BZ3500_MvSof-1268-A1-R1_Chr4-1g06694 [Microbotryum saponariae]SDA06359.1 BZ3501_MvSof-1269-A2-R1_Chr4-1g06404 [Microbotryum saponariae]
MDSAGVPPIPTGTTTASSLALSHADSATGTCLDVDVIISAANPVPGVVAESMIAAAEHASPGQDYDSTVKPEVDQDGKVGTTRGHQLLVDATQPSESELTATIDLNHNEHEKAVGTSGTSPDAFNASSRPLTPQLGKAANMEDDEVTVVGRPPSLPVTHVAEDPEPPRRPPAEQLDIEHLEVTNDPRAWSTRRKNLILVCIAYNAAGGQLSSSIYFPALKSLQADLNASDSLVAASVSLFILGQGVTPVFWSALSEIKGRKTCYITAIIIYLVATTVCSRADKIGVFVAMRLLQSLGSGAPLSLGAGTLSDIFDVHERGTKIGFFYGVPLLAPSLGPLLGGALAEAGSWRTTFYFLIGYGVICLMTMIWLPETFRRERSLAWRLAMKRARAHAKANRLKAEAALPKNDTLPLTRGPPQTSFAPGPQRSNGPTALTRVMTALSGRSGDDNVKIHLRDINVSQRKPTVPYRAVLAQKNNFISIAFSGLVRATSGPPGEMHIAFPSSSDRRLPIEQLFASTYCITFTISRTFAAAPYNYSALKTGLVLLCLGTGNFIGSVLGGRYSDYVFNKLKAKSGGKGSPEMRIKSTRLAMVLVPCFYIVYAWTVQKRTNAAGPLVALLFLGLSIMVLYSSLLSYVVDANPGRSSSAVACNSLFRGVLACVASQVAEPIIGHIGNGWFYTGFAVLLTVGSVALLYVGANGQRWRERQLERSVHELDPSRTKP